MKSWKQAVKFLNKENMGAGHTSSSPRQMWIPYLDIKEYIKFILRHKMLHIKNTL